MPSLRLEYPIIKGPAHVVFATPDAKVTRSVFVEEGLSSEDLAPQVAIDLCEYLEHIGQKGFEPMKSYASKDEAMARPGPIEEKIAEAEDRNGLLQAVIDRLNQLEKILYEAGITREISK